MVVDDVEAVRSVETEALGKATSAEQWERELTTPFSRTLVGRREGEGVMGFVNFWLVADEAQLVQIAVAPRWRRSGVAKGLMKVMMAIAAEADVEKVVLEVNTVNDPAVSLYRKIGFEPVALRKAYYAPQDGDALIMTLTLRGRNEKLCKCL